MRRGGANFTAIEFHRVMSYYDLGTIISVGSLRVGNTHTPKKIVNTENGRYLLKRRPRGSDDIYHVAYAHSIQSYLAQRGFPIARLVRTFKDHNTALHLDNHVYELFEYVEGSRYPASVAQMRDAGRQLAEFHKHLSHFQCSIDPLRLTYHDSAQVINCLKRVSTARNNAPDQESMVRLAECLIDHYINSSKEVNESSYSMWPEQIVHGDWHPGNMLFSGDGVAAVLDFDSVKVAPKMIDVANALLQFSIIAGDKDTSKWPCHADMNKFTDFIEGYLEVEDADESMLRALPCLMIETMIAEAILPIATTGTFGRHCGFSFLTMILRKSDWINLNKTKLSEAVLHVR